MNDDDHFSFDHADDATGFADGAPVPVVNFNYETEEEFIDFVKAIGGGRVALALLHKHELIPDIVNADKIEEARLETGNYVLTRIARAGKDTGRLVDQFCYVFDVQGMPTMTHTALNVHRLSKQAFNKGLKKFQRELKVPPSSYMKSEAACKKHALYNNSRSTGNKVPPKQRNNHE